MNFPFLYFDAGTGALIVQFLAAGAAGVVLFYNRIKTGFQSMFGKKQDPGLMGDIDIEEQQDADENK